MTDTPMLQPHAVRYQFVPAEMFVGAPMDTAHLSDPHAITVEWRGGDRWAVMAGAGWSPQRVWSEVDGEWEYEPLPSERGDDFLKRTRYDRETALSIGAKLAGVSGD